MIVVIPLKDENGVLVLDQVLLDLRQGSVENAMKYRTKPVNLVVDYVRRVRPR